MIAMAVFLVIGGTALTLFQQNANLYTNQQGTTALNISMRNALVQIQNDAANAANGYFQTGTMGWPIGITINNVNPGYDTLNIITPAISPAQLPTGTCINTSTGTGTIVTPTGVTATQYPANSEALIVNGAGNQMTTVMLKTATASGANMNLTFAATSTTGINTAANDPLGITTQAFAATDPDKLGDQFCAPGDWLVPLTTITYTVNGTNQLTRQYGSNAADIIAEQVIAFKVGAALFNTLGGGSSGAYVYTGPGGYEPRAIRAVRVSVIGRTPPGQWSGTDFTNSFDGGNYKIEALSLVINPRNLSMNDCGSCS